MPRLGLRNWRVRTRLTVLILVPTIVGVVLAGARVVGSVESVGSYDHTIVVAEQAGRLRNLIQSLAIERDTTGWYYASRKNKIYKKGWQESRAKVDSLLQPVKSDLEAIRASTDTTVHRSAVLAGNQLKAITDIRGAARIDSYRNVLDSLVQLHDGLSLLQSDPTIIGSFRALGALTQAGLEVSNQRVLLLQAYYAHEMDALTSKELIASGARQQSALATFRAVFNQDVATGQLGKNPNEELQGLMKTSSSTVAVELAKSRAVTLAATKSADAGLLSSPGEWVDDNAVILEAMHRVEVGVADDVLLRAQEMRQSQLNAAIVAGASILGLILLVLLLTVIIARSMVTPLRRLRGEALDIAGHRLPDVVRRLRLSGAAGLPEMVPISVEGKDEIGELAQAFDEVHRQAVRLAAEEAELRGNISSMFVNLSRRTQTLVERQISLIDGLEKGEEDGGRLADLFKLDHLATRMRRNSENLLVLAGHEPTRRRSQPAKLVDVVRASLSEVEDYERVQVKVHRATQVVGSAANDLVHLIAELVENAIQFSPKSSQVQVSSSMIEGGGALLSVNDAGISMTEEELAEANRRLAEPPVVDVSVSRRMGLFVVGRLALRHGIRVQLRRGEQSGLIAMVLLPPALIVGTPMPVPSRPVGIGGLSADPSFGSAAQNGSYSRGGGYESFDTSGFGGEMSPGRGGGIGPFTSDTGGGLGSYPSFPSVQNYPSLPDGRGRPGLPSGQNHPSLPSGQSRPSEANYSNGSGPLSGASYPSIGSPSSDTNYPSIGSPSSDTNYPSIGSPPSGANYPSIGNPSSAANYPSIGNPPSGANQPGTPNYPSLPSGQNYPSLPSGQNYPSVENALPKREPRQNTGSFAMPTPAGAPPLSAPPMNSPPMNSPSMNAPPRGGSAFDAVERKPAEPPQEFASWSQGPVDDANTASFPAISAKPSEPDREEFLPIFASMESRWFLKPPGEEANPAENESSAKDEGQVKDPEVKYHMPADTRRDDLRRAQAVPSGEDGWRTAADAGWQAAEAAADPSLGGITSAGLPKRTPKANLVPGTASQPARPLSPMPPVSADRVRSRMASFQQGVRRGRAEVRDESVPAGTDKEEERP